MRKEEGIYVRLSKNQTSTLEHLREISIGFRAGAVNDAETVATIEKVFNQFGYLADPHTSVGMAIAEQIYEMGAHGRGCNRSSC